MMDEPEIIFPNSEVCKQTFLFITIYFLLIFEALAGASFPTNC